MAWTTPKTWLKNERVTSNNFNKHVSDNLSAISNPSTVFTTFNDSRSISSVSYADFSGSIQDSITLSRSGILLAVFNGVLNTTSAQFVDLRFDLDGSPTNNLARLKLGVVNDPFHAVQILYRWTGLTLTSHTIKVQGKGETATTINMRGDSGLSTLWLIEGT